MHIFWKKGFEGTSYTDLVSESDLLKGSLYQAFGDKRKLYLKVLTHYKDHEIANMISILTNPNETGKNRIHQLLTKIIEMASIHNNRLGCLLCNAAIDQSVHDPSTQEIVGDGFRQMQNAFLTALSTMSDQQGREEKANLAMATYFGIQVMVKSGIPTIALEGARDGLIKALESNIKSIAY